MAGKIFINYRRDDSPADARNIREGLAAKFGKSAVFMDVDNLLGGQRFDRELAKALDQCDVLVSVIGAHWMALLAERTQSGERDYVREEIAAALKREIPVIPVRVGREGTMPPLPRGEDLPTDIRDLVLHQKHDVAHERSGRDIEDLANSIAAVRGRGGGGLPTSYWIAAALVLAVVGSASWWSLRSATAPKHDPEVADMCDRYWNKIKDATSLGMMEAYIQDCGRTLHGKLATARLSELKAEQTARENRQKEAEQKRAAEKRAADAKEERAREQAVAATAAAQTRPANEVSSFTWTTSPNEIDPGIRIWRREKDGGTWKESWPSGNVTTSTIQDRTEVDGCNGVVVRRQDDPNLYVFIPDKGCRAMFFQFRRGTTGSWNKLALMQNVK